MGEYDLDIQIPQTTSNLRSFMLDTEHHKSLPHPQYTSKRVNIPQHQADFEIYGEGNS
jgi:hypothetical protein